LKLEILEDNICVRLKSSDEKNVLNTIYYSKNDSTQRKWEEYIVGTPIYVNKNDIIRFWNKNVFLSKKEAVYRFEITRGNEA